MRSFAVSITVRGQDGQDKTIILLVENVRSRGEAFNRIRSNLRRGVDAKLELEEV